ncbi:MAG: GDSL-type esterase/lipase family protein, partial [Actinomycetota bacterium]
MSTSAKRWSMNAAGWVATGALLATTIVVGLADRSADAQPPVVQDFEGVVSGSDPVGWLDTGAWNSLAEDDSLFSVSTVDGSQVLGTSSSGSNIHSHYVAESMSAADGFVLSGRMQMTAASSGVGVTVLSDYPGSDSYYRLRRFSGQGGSFRLSPHGTSVSGDTDSGVVPSPNEWYEFEIEVTDTGSATVIRARVWESGSVKPSAWQIDAVDSSASRLTTGSIGVWGHAGGSKYWDDFVVSAVAEPGPWTVDVTPSGGGSVSLSPAQSEYVDGSSVELTATPDAGWSFVGWTGGASGAANPLQLEVTSDVAIGATFVEDVPVTLSASVVGDGVVSLSPDQATYDVGDQVTVTAVAGDGQRFVGWSGDATGTENPLTITMSADTDVTATFQPIPDDTLRVMAVGDSITAGASSFGPGVSGTYRYHLQRWIETGGSDAEFVGPYDEHPSGEFLAQGLWDHDSLAIEGWQTRDVRDAIGPVVAAEQPDVILMMIGVNDLRGNSITPSLATSRVQSAINNARAEQPDVAVLLAEIPPENLAGSEITEFNALLRGLADSTTTAQSPVVTVDLNTGFDIGAQTNDGLHPNDDGDRWLAERWATALASLTGLAVSDPYGQVELTLQTNGQGELEAAPAGGTHQVGDLVTLTAAADSGWSFERWLVDPPVPSDWWNSQWGYRTRIEVDPAGVARTDALVDMPIDFSAAFTQVGIARTLDPASIRVVEVGSGGGVTNASVPFQFDPAPGYDPVSAASGTLWIELSGVTESTSRRYFDVYFDVAGTQLPPASFAPQISVAESVAHSGLDTLRISTSNGTYYYDVDGAGFASVVDGDGNDWIAWSSAAGSAGAFRGIPNLVFPAGDFHPGNGGSTTTLVSSGPLVATFRSTTADGAWTSEWSVGDDFAQLTVLDAASDYWFLYEGTPGGTLDVNSDIVVRSDGTTTTAATEWVGDLVGTEWVSFGDPTVGRSLFVVNHQDDIATDSYRPMNGEMTVFGFGRENLSSSLEHVPGQYTFGLVDATAYNAVSPVVSEVAAPIAVQTLTVEGQLGPDASSSASFEIGADTAVTAVFAETGNQTGSLSTSTIGPGSVSVEPAKAQYYVGEEVTLTATPQSGAVFTGWSGAASGSSNPLVVTVGVSTSVTATFESASGGPNIDVWNGLQQRFGDLGVPQVAVNVLGNVTDPNGVATLTYSLNGGPDTSLRIGPDFRRLARTGDFNVELPVVMLSDGANALRLTATDSAGDVSVVDVEVFFDDGTTWPESYSVDWSTVAEVSDAAQIVDGRWTLDGDGARIVEPSYDRLLALGDISWTEYEVTVPVTINALDESGFSSGLSGTAAGLGLLVRWSGHTDNPVATAQPKSGWLPHGAIGWWWWDTPTSARLQLTGNNGSTLAALPYGAPPAVGTTLIYKMRVETDDFGVPRYSLKVWPDDQSEPASWTLAGFDEPDDPQLGSLVLLAHHVDATFGDVTVEPLGSGGAGLTVDVGTTGDGTVSVAPSQEQYAFGTEVTVEATAADGWTFTGWTGDLTGSENPLTWSLIDSVVATASFVRESDDPVISDVVVTPYAEGASVSWTTDKPTTGSVQYGSTSAYELGVAGSPVLSTSHSVDIAGLSADSTYHFSIVVNDAFGNSSQTPDAQFTTRSSGVTGFVSDDFNSCAVDGGLWTFVNPVGDGTVGVNGTQLELGVPGGVSHD